MVSFCFVIFVEKKPVQANFLYQNMTFTNRTLTSSDYAKPVVHESLHLVGSGDYNDINGKSKE